MKAHVLVWAAVGFLTAAFWAVYLFVTPPPVGPGLLMAAKATMPFAFASIHFHFGLTYYWAIVANTVTYGLLGLLIETMRRHKHAL